MKCPECRQSQQWKDGSKCTRCGYVYCFGRGSGTTDGKFRALLRRASAGDTQYFTFEQLYTAYCQDRPAEGGSVGCGAMAGALTAFGLALGAIFTAFLVDGGWRVAAVVCGFALAGLGGYAVIAGREPLRPPSRETLRSWVTAWRNAGKAMPRLLDAPALHAAPQGYREPDLFDYGAERVLVVQHDLLVDLLVKNAFHVKERTIVVSERGYPRHVMPHLRRLLEERPEIPVVLLHDATPAGVAMERRLRAGRLLPEGTTFLDAGLFPADVPRLRVLDRTMPDRIGNAVRADALPMALLAAGLAEVFRSAVRLGQAMEASQSGRTSGEDGSGLADFG